MERAVGVGRIRVRLRDDAVGATPLELPERRLWPLSLVVGVMFAIFAAIAWTTGASIVGESVRDVFDLMFVLFKGFWLLGWSVGVVILGALTVLLFFYGESARLQGGRLVHVPRLGPVKIIIEYDLARVRNVRVETAGNAGNPDIARIRFDYAGGSSGLGDTMPRAEAERLVRTISSAAAGAGTVVETVAAPAGPEVLPPERRIPADDSAPALTSPSGLALIAANLVPLAGVVFFGWDLPSVLVLFWAESAVIGVYTALKMAVVGKLAAIVAVPFFIGHFGGFMAGHFLFIYMFFVRGIDAAGPSPGAREALYSIFNPLWLPLAGLVISHGVSFFDNFLGRREYLDATMKALMTAPYNRIVVMQVALIFGGWVVMLLKNPVPALALLVLFKTVLDSTAHRKEHGD